MNYNANHSKFCRTLIALILAAMLFVCSACNLLAGQPPAPKTISLEPKELSLQVGETYQLTATTSEKTEIIWSSDNEHVAVVDGDGNVEAVSAGEATIIVSCEFGDAVCDVTVIGSTVRPGSYVAVTPKELSLQVGEKFQLKAATSNYTSVTWRSANVAIATVDENGFVEGVSEGTVNVIATSATAGEDFCSVTVVPKRETPKSVKLTPESAELQAGDTLQLTASASDASAVNFRSENEAVATVSASGLVKAVSAGETRIIAYSNSAGEAFCKITVTARQADEPVLVWSDEFNGTSLNEADWEYQLGVRDEYGSSTGPWFWGNNEQQYYTKEATSVADGALRITATRQSMPEGRLFSSSRITTRDRHSFTYGYFEARMKTPAQDGMWPAFWMLPQPSNRNSTNNQYGGWAASGEIDIMEAKGRLKNRVDNTLHYGDPGSSTYRTKSTQLSSSTEEWHTYGLDWTADYIAWFVDGQETMRISSGVWWSANADKVSKPSAPFDVDFYILFDLAVGGNYDGGTMPDVSFTSATMYVDYVRVYQYR